MQFCTYGPSIFESSGLSRGDSLFYQTLIGTVNMLTTVLALLIIDKIDEKLVYIGVSGMIVSLVCIGLYFSFAEIWGLSLHFFVNMFSCLHVLLCRIYQCSYFCISFRNVPHPYQRISLCLLLLFRYGLAPISLVNLPHGCLKH